MILLVIPVIVAIVVVGFIAGVGALRNRYGGAVPNRIFAGAMLGLAMVLDVLVITFSISVCSYAARQGLELRGDALQNADVLRLLAGVSSEDESMRISGLWGFIIPLMSWVTAHGLMFSIIEIIRQSGPAFVDRLMLTRQAGTAAAQRVALRLQNRIMRILSFGLIGVASGAIFIQVINFDKLLFQYQMIDSSLLRKALGGKGWALRYSQQDLHGELGNTFLGQMALHAGDFYVICLLVTAALLVVAIHQAVHANGHEPNPVGEPSPFGTIYGTPRRPHYPASAGPLIPDGQTPPADAPGPETPAQETTSEPTPQGPEDDYIQIDEQR